MQWWHPQVVLGLRTGWAHGVACLVGSSCAAELHFVLPGPQLREEVVSCPVLPGGLQCCPSSHLSRWPVLVPRFGTYTCHTGCQGLVLRGEVDVRVASGTIICRSWFCLTDPVPKPLVEKQHFARQCPPWR